LARLVERTLLLRSKIGFAFAARRSTSSLVRRRACESSARLRAEYPSQIIRQNGLKNSRANPSRQSGRSKPLPYRSQTIRQKILA